MRWTVATLLAVVLLAGAAQGRELPESGTGLPQSSEASSVGLPQSSGASSVAYPEPWTLPYKNTKPIIGILAQACHYCPGR